MKKILLLAACLAAPTLAHAGCDAFFPVWAKTFAPGRTPGAAAPTCKPWPANPALTLGVMTFQPQGEELQSGVADLLLLVADSRSGAVSAHLLQAGGLIVDTMHGTDYDLDTARYQLTPSIRAFGIRVPLAGSSHLWPRSTEGLSLYVIDGPTLRPVLVKLQTSLHEGEWDGNCAGRYTDITRTISMGAPGQQGYADLLLNEQTRETVSTEKKDQCNDKQAPVRRKSYTLRYSDGAYALPQPLSN